MASNAAPFFVLSVILQLFLSAAVLASSPSPCKVLVVMSYHDQYAWQQEELQGIDATLSKTCEIKYFALDTKRNPAHGRQKAREAYQLYKRYKPDGVIAVDDAAQSLFIVPYLRDKVKTPVIFCGVNNPPGDYGYPSSNVTGVLEYYHAKASVEFLKELAPPIKNIAVMMRSGDPSTKGNMDRIRTEAGKYPVTVTAFSEPGTLEEAVEHARQLVSKVDGLFFEHFEGLPDQNGSTHTSEEVVKAILTAFGNKPTVCAHNFTVEAGCLCAIVESGLEQGTTAGKLLLQTLSGTPLAEIPITRNYEGIKYINVTVMKMLGITPAPELLRGVKLVKTQELRNSSGRTP